MSHTTVRRTCALYFFAAARYNLAESPVWYDARRNMQKQVKIATQRLPIDEWVKGLAAIRESEFTLEAVQDYILQHAVLPETLEKYLFFSKGNYTRNLIFKNDVFECMTICWEIGQFSRIHNHRDLRHGRRTSRLCQSARASAPSPESRGV